MSNTRYVLALALAAALLAPATSHAQADVMQTCHSLLGSGTVDVTAVAIDRCGAARRPANCTLTDTIDLGLVRIRHGICLDLDEALTSRTVGVRGVATIRILP